VDKVTFFLIISGIFQKTIHPSQNCDPQLYLSRVQGPHFFEYILIPKNLTKHLTGHNQRETGPWHYLTRLYAIF